jgi:hypothetical protein
MYEVQTVRKAEKQIGSWREPDGLCGGNVRPIKCFGEAKPVGDCGYSMHTRNPRRILLAIAELGRAWYRSTSENGRVVACCGNVIHKRMRRPC